MLIVGAGSLQKKRAEIPVIGDASSQRQSLVDFAARGGRVLVLRQEAYPEGLFDVSLTSQRSTIAFAQATHHPALSGLSADDLRFWRGDHLVAEGELVRPTAGALPIIVSGSAAGIDTTPLVAQPVGRGCLVFCQMMVTEKFDREPAAARLLTNLITWLAGYQSRSGATAVVGPPEFTTLLRSLGLHFDDWTVRPPEGDWSAHRLLVCGQEPPDLVRLRRYVEQGGTVWLHGLPWQRIGPVAAALGIPLEARPFTGPVARVETDDPLLDYITREDLYWLGRHDGIGWSETPRADRMADAVFGRVATAPDDNRDDVRFLTAPAALAVTRCGQGLVVWDQIVWDTEEQNARKATRFAGSLLTALGAEFTLRAGTVVEAERMTPQPGVPHFSNTGSFASMACSGYIATPVRVVTAGQYVLEVVAAGSSAAGIYPEIDVLVDGQSAGTIHLTSADWRAVLVAVRVARRRPRAASGFHERLQRRRRGSQSATRQVHLLSRVTGLTSPRQSCRVCTVRQTLLLPIARPLPARPPATRTRRLWRTAHRQVGLRKHRPVSASDEPRPVRRRPTPPTANESPGPACRTQRGDCIHHSEQRMITTASKALHDRRE